MAELPVRQPNATSNKERLLRQGMKLFYANGFHGTTVDAVLEASGVPKGSFYHHFGSKEAFGLAVLDRYMSLQLELLEAASVASSAATADTLERYFDSLCQLFVDSGYRRGCLAGKFSTELAASSTPFRSQLAGSIATWHDTLAALLEQGQRRGDVRDDLSAGDLAHTVLALVQGAFVIALSSRDPAALAALRVSIRSLVELDR
ncbi:TetR/AcrR family transcriptional regulator [Mycobacterium sp. MS1601]|uniref:TetR/AcrR family transcriptional regulator n=1 Tax=Mycobacterium sp. MS1601 TaxID=1936029 RepID=UPI001F3687E9|nr:TetR/AcrR family transcriptional regulator [Mycobacterium sp. MS1601]